MANEFKRYANKLRNLETRLNRSNATAQVVGEEFAQGVRDHLPVIQDYRKGSGNELGRVSSRVARQTATITWSGAGIWYIEFGTGSPAVGKYPDSAQMGEANGYEPRPNGHTLGQYWVLPMDEYSLSDGRPVITKGWAPYAPFYTTQMEYQMGKYKEPIANAAREQVENAL